jgi:hypothetical protein
MIEAKLKGIHVIVLAPWKKSNLWTIKCISIKQGLGHLFP